MVCGSVLRPCSLWLIQDDDSQRQQNLLSEFTVLSVLEAKVQEIFVIFEENPVQLTSVSDVFF